MSNSLNRQRAKGRRKTRPFLMLDRDMLNSPQWAALSPYGKSLMLDLAVQYNGSNNGDLCAAWSLMRKRGWASPGTLSRALHELVAKGWADLARQGGRNRPSLYALTIWGVNDCGGKPDIPANPVPAHRWKIRLSSPDVYQSSPDVYQSAQDRFQKAA